MRGALTAFVRFWIDFVLGDDWMVAAAIALGLVATGALSATGFPAWWLLPLVVVAAALISLRRAVARGG
jgi:hypothetical protein